MDKIKNIVQASIDVKTLVLQNEDLLKAKGEAAKNYVYSKTGATKEVVRYIQEKRLLTN